MVVLYDKSNGRIVATIDRAREYPGDIPEGMGVLATSQELGSRALRYRVDPISNTLVERSEDDIRSEAEERRRIDEEERNRIRLAQEENAKD